MTEGTKGGDSGWRQEGQLLCLWSNCQVSKHTMWNRCPQEVTRTASGSSSSSRQMGHGSSSLSSEVEGDGSLLEVTVLGIEG